MIQIWMLLLLSVSATMMEEKYTQLFDHMRKQGCMISSSLEYIVRAHQTFAKDLHTHSMI